MTSQWVSVPPTTTSTSYEGLRPITPSRIINFRPVSSAGHWYPRFKRENTPNMNHLLSQQVYSRMRRVFFSCANSMANAQGIGREWSFSRSSASFLALRGIKLREALRRFKEGQIHWVHLRRFKRRGSSLSSHSREWILWSKGSKMTSVSQWRRSWRNLRLNIRYSNSKSRHG